MSRAALPAIKKAPAHGGHAGGKFEGRMQDRGSHFHKVLPRPVCLTLAAVYHNFKCGVPSGGPSFSGRVGAV